MSSIRSVSADGFTRYPLSSLLIYNGMTVLHFLLGGIGIAMGYPNSPAATAFAGLYMVFAFGQMYILMPLTVCRNCVYYGLENGRCVTGLNIVARRITGPGDTQQFASRAQGILCHNNLYMGALVLPLLAMLPGLLINFSLGLLAVFLFVMGLLLLRIFVLFRRVACVNCTMKDLCPNAQSMGIGSGQS